MSGSGSPLWSDDRLAAHLERLATSWRRADGMLATAYRRGRCVDEMPLVGELGDVAPFLVRLGRREEALEQARLARGFLVGGLFAWQGRRRLFHNHDFLLGLIELYETTGETWLLDSVLRGLEALKREFDLRGLLIDAAWPERRVFAARASPFNGGFVELAVDVYNATRDESWLELARRWARAWVATPFFRRYGLFAARRLLLAPALGMTAGRFARRGPVRLSKDNTLLAWSLLALYRVCRDSWSEQAIGRFLDGFEARLLHRGIVRQALGDPPERWNLYASSAALDLLCDLAAWGPQSDRCLGLAREVGGACLREQWPNGLFEVEAGAGRDHLDLMTDVGVGLSKLGELTGEDRYREAALRGWASALRLHATEDGLALAVTRDGGFADERIIVKYQALALKSHLVAASPTGIFEDPALWSLVRDR